MSNDKIKLVPIISVLLATGFLITSLASYYVSRTSLRSEISRHELPLTSASYIQAEIQSQLLRPVLISSLMANDTFLRDWVINGEIEEKEITRYLKEIQSKYNTLTSFFVSDKTLTYYQANGILKKVSPLEERDSWYYRTRAMKADFEINIDPDLANKDSMTFFINYRVYDHDNNYIGATGVGIAVSAVNDLIELYQQKYNRTIYFIDKNGNIKLTGSSFNSAIKNISQFKHFPLFDIKDNLKTEQIFSYKKDGQIFHNNIRYIEELDWYLVVEKSEQKTTKNIFTILLINLLICIITTIVILFLVIKAITAYKKRIETLRGIVPICSFCKQIRDDKGYWNRVETYVAKHTDAQFSHGICPTCMEKHYPEENKAINEQKVRDRN